MGKITPSDRPNAIQELRSGSAWHAHDREGIPRVNNRRQALATQRIGRRTLITSAGLLSAGLVMPRSAEAARGWCRTDPLILIDGELADIFCTAPLSMLVKATGPTEFVVTLPKGVSGTLILAGPGFLQGERLRFEYSHDLAKTSRKIEINVAVHVPAEEDLPIGLEFAPRLLGILKPDRADGKANSWVSLKSDF